MRIPQSLFSRKFPFTVLPFPWRSTMHPVLLRIVL